MDIEYRNLEISNIIKKGKGMGPARQLPWSFVPSDVEWPSLISL